MALTPLTEHCLAASIPALAMEPTVLAPFLISSSTELIPLPIAAISDVTFF